MDIAVIWRQVVRSRAFVRVDKALKHAEDVSLLLACVGVAVMFALVIFNVSARYVMVQPPVWPDPITELSVLIVTALAAPAVLRANGHIVVDVAINSVPPNWARYMGVVADAFGALACGIMSFGAAIVTVEAFQRNVQEMRAISVHFSVLSAPIAIAFGLLAVGYVLKLLQRLSEKPSHSDCED